MRITSLCFLCFSLMFTKSVRSQNLIPNSSFELMDSCPSGLGELNFLTNWFNPFPDSISSPDYFNTCSPPGVSPPQCFFGYQLPHTGNGYSGIYVYYNSPVGGANSREYVAVKFSSPLLQNEHYYFEVFVSAADDFQYCISNIGAYFTDTINLPANGSVINVNPQILNSSGILSDTSNWSKVSGVYIANGGEEFLILGNFNPDSTTTVSLVYPTAQSTGSYYLFDDAILVHGDSLSSLNEVQFSNLFYLSETADQLTIHNPSSTMIESIECVDILGHLVQKIKFDKSISEIPFELKFITTGMYFIRIEANNTIHTIKYIKK